MRVGSPLRRLWPLAHLGERLVLPDQAGQLGQQIVGRALASSRLAGGLAVGVARAAKIGVVCHTHTATHTASVGMSLTAIGMTVDRGSSASNGTERDHLISTGASTPSNSSPDARTVTT